MIRRCLHIYFIIITEIILIQLNNLSSRLDLNVIILEIVTQKNNQQLFVPLNTLKK
jgi:hypothetical protein